MTAQSGGRKARGLEIPADLQDRIDGFMELHGPDTEDVLAAVLRYVGFSEDAAAEANQVQASTVEKARDAGLVAPADADVLLGLLHATLISGVLLGRLEMEAHQ